jgi:hypothetical protein
VPSRLLDEAMKLRLAASLDERARRGDTWIRADAREVGSAGGGAARGGSRPLGPVLSDGAVGHRGALYGASDAPRRDSYAQEGARDAGYRRRYGPGSMRSAQGTVEFSAPRAHPGGRALGRQFGRVGGLHPELANIDGAIGQSAGDIDELPVVRKHDHLHMV